MLTIPRSLRLTGMQAQECRLETGIETVPPSDEDALIERAREGSPAAFDELVRRYDRPVLRLALGIVKTEEDARDVYQETFLKAWKGIRGFRSECSFGTWIFRIATNLCLDHARRRGPVRHEPLEDAGTARGGPGAAVRLVDRSVEGNPVKAVEAGELRRLIGTALADLPPRERLVFGLRHGEGLRLGAIAAILETSEDTARNCLYRAHQRLRAALRHVHGGAGAAAPSRTTERTTRSAPLRDTPEVLGGTE